MISQEGVGASQILVTSSWRDWLEIGANSVVESDKLQLVVFLQVEGMDLLPFTTSQEFTYFSWCT